MTVTLKDWAKQNSLKDHKTSPEEIKSLLKLADEKLRDCSIAADTEISVDSYSELAYYAALPCAKAVLAVSGYRVSTDAAGGHHKLFYALSFEFDKADKYVQQLQAARIRRTQTTYQSVGNQSKTEAQKFYELVLDLRKKAEEWIRKQSPELLK